MGQGRTRFRLASGARLALGAAAAVGLAGASLPAAGAVGNNDAHRASHHVLLLSVDGMHQQDLEWYVAHNPNSAIASLVAGGSEYTAAETPFPSDSFPGTVAEFTGGDPAVTGVYYDDTYNHDVLPAGTTDCKGKAPGAEVDYTEDLDLNKTSLDAGQGLPGLPGTILNMTGQPRTLINPAKLPVDPKTCKPVYPDQYLQTNTVFTVAHDAGLRTAYSDKHPAYEILAGPGGKAIDDLFTPEINSDATGYPAGDDWTSDNAATMQYDNYKVQAVLNEIDGYDHSRTKKVGTPAIFGMNFQTVSTAEKLPFSDNLVGGYQAGGTQPGPLLIRALNFVNFELQAMINHINADGLASTTTIILTAKHGQSPTDPNELVRVPDSPIIANLNAAWKTIHPNEPNLVVFSTDDDGMLLWLSDRSAVATSFAEDWLLSHSATGNTVTGSPTTVTSSGLATAYAGPSAAQFFGVPVSDPRHPDLVGIVQHGVVYTGGEGKIAEHGGDDPQDRDVLLVVSGAGAPAGVVNDTPLEDTSIAPTILHLLGLNAQALQAVRVEHTPVLPGM